MSLLVMRRLIVEIELLADRAELIVLPPPCPLDVQPVDFDHADELIRRGYEGRPRPPRADRWGPHVLDPVLDEAPFASLRRRPTRR